MIAATATTASRLDSPPAIRSADQGGQLGRGGRGGAGRGPADDHGDLAAHLALGPARQVAQASAVLSGVYKKGSGYRYHYQFSKLRLNSEYADKVSFIELLDCPTYGKTSHTFKTIIK